MYYACVWLNTLLFSCLLTINFRCMCVFGRQGRREKEGPIPGGNQQPSLFRPVGQQKVKQTTAETFTWPQISMHDSTVKKHSRPSLDPLPWIPAAGNSSVPLSRPLPPQTCREPGLHLRPGSTQQACLSPLPLKQFSFFPLISLSIQSRLTGLILKDKSQS